MIYNLLSVFLNLAHDYFKANIYTVFIKKKMDLELLGFFSY